MELVKQFKDINVNDVAIAGGKGANLGEMTAAGIKVPDGFVVTSDAYRLFLNENKFTNMFSEKLAEANGDETKLISCAKEFRELIKNAVIPDDVRKAVNIYYNALGADQRVAVRSSATAEDLPDASFAGQQETYLNIIGIENVYEKIKDCYASLWGDRAVIYRHNQGYDQKSVALAVVIQRMIESEISGVLFTVNPVTADKDEMQINASYGLGESVVSGRVIADSYVCSKDCDIRKINIGAKKTQIIYDADGGTKEIPVDKKMQETQALDNEQIKRLCLEGKKIEEHYHMPMDIEWGIKDDIIYILQARAITTLNNEKSSFDEAEIEKYLEKCKCSGAQRSNMTFLLEKMPYVFYPNEYELIEIIDDQKSVIFSEAGIIMDMQPEIDDDGVMVLPPNGVTLSKNIVNFPKLYKELSNLSLCRKKLEAGMEEFRHELDAIKAKDYENMSIYECGELNEYFKEYVRRLTYLRFKYALFPSALCKMKFKKILTKVDKKLTMYDLYQNLDYETALMTKDIEGLALQFSEIEHLADDIKSGAGYKEVCEKYPKADTLMKEFLEKHGYKSDFNCYCVTAKSFYEDPDRIINLVRPLLGAEKKEEKDGFGEIMKSLRAKAGQKKYDRLAEDIDTLRYMHVIREESQMMWETSFFYIKKLLKRIAYILFDDENYMNNIAYLFTSELTQLCKKGMVTNEYVEKIERRKAKRPLAEKVWEAAKLKVFKDTGDMLKGVSGSVGEATGKVCVINGPEEFYKFQKGDILVCRLTDPEWTPLFSLASAVVADTGAELSHAAIVAREYGIPAVLGVGFATAKYKDGDMIHVNGTKGIVSKIG